MACDMGVTTTWRQQWAGKVRTPEDLVRFVGAMGCCTLDSLPGYPDFPASSAVMGALDAEAPDLWFWKDDLHIEKRLYYTRVFGGRPGYVSYALLPALIATNGAVADELMQTGELSPAAQEVYRAIEAHGPIPSRNLKRLLTPDVTRSATTILHHLERRFIITKTGLTGRTRGTYGYIWNLTERWMPEMLAAADRLGRPRAHALIYAHLADTGIPQQSPFYRKVLGWEPNCR